MARRKKVRRTMGERAVRVTITLSVADGRKITDKAWVALDDEIEGFIDACASRTIFTTPTNVDVTYSRDVELREPWSVG